MHKLRKALAVFMIVALTQGAVSIDVLAEGPGGPGEQGAPGGISEKDLNDAVLGKQVGSGTSANTGATSTLQLTDYDKVDSKEAVALMVKLGLIKGKVQADNTVKYEPDSNLTRAEMAKLIAMSITLVSKEKIEGVSSFNDIEGNWASDYIKFCADKGIMNGVGNGAYDPDSTITGLETEKLLLAAMGVRNLNGSDWEAKTQEAAKDKGLLKDTRAVGKTPIDRDDAAQLIYNALTISSGNSILPQVIVVNETTEKEKLTLTTNTMVTATEGKLVSMVVDSKETAMKPGTYRNAYLVVTDKVKTNPSSYSGRGIDDLRAAISIDKNGLVKEQSVIQVVYSGTYSGTQASDIKINSNSDNFTAIKVDGADYTIRNSTFNLLGNSDGSNVSDFTGLGSVISCYNDAKVKLDKVNITSKGVARPALYVDGGSDTLFTDSTFNVLGGTLYKGYVSTADQTKMVAPPWVLGITGNSRGTNLMGNNSTSTFVRSICNSNQWGVLSTDAGSNCNLYSVDSVLTLLGKGQNDPFSKNFGSGYGTYIIGNAKEYFYGTTFNVGTYASILTGGMATYASSRFTKPLDIYSQDNGTTPVFKGITGLGKVTTINSDAFGFMAHQGGILNITDGTVVNTNNAAFLLKSGDVSINVSDGAEINTKDGVILQMMDNDDKVVGAEMGTGGPNFKMEFNEKAGFPGIDYNTVKNTESKNKITFNATDVTLNGNIYNGTGYFGGMKPGSLAVTLGKGASLTGAISATTVQHVDENGKQNTHFTSDEYYYLGHVANKMYYNGGNNISVTLKDGASWTVTDTGIISSLSIEKGCTFTGKITVDGKTMTADEVTAKGTVTGTIVVSAQ